MIEVHEDGSADSIGWDGGISAADVYEWGPRIEPRRLASVRLIT